MAMPSTRTPSQITEVSVDVSMATVPAEAAPRNSTATRLRPTWRIALERMLFFNPNLPRVKLELGVLYFKLDSFELARGYLQDAGKGADVPDDIRAQTRAYLAEIDRRLSRHEYSVFLQGGMR